MRGVGCSIFKSYPPQSFRIMLCHISQHLSDDKMLKVAFIYKIPRILNEETISTLSLLQELEKRGEFSSSNVQPLERMLSQIDRYDLVNMVQQYKLQGEKKSVAKVHTNPMAPTSLPQFQELAPTPPASPKAKDDATPVNDIDEEASLPSIK